MDWYDVLWTRMADASLRAAALALLAALPAWLLRRSPSARHAVWTVVLAGMLVMPLLRPVVPAAHVPVPHAAIPTLVGQVPDLPGTTPVPDLPKPTRAPAPRLPWTFYAAAAYLAGLAWFAARLALGFRLTRRLLRGARPVELAGAAESGRLRVPVTLGLRRPRVVLPAEWRSWPDEKLSIVLAHEAAHVRRRDPLIAALAAANCCMFWFHPLAWWLERHLAALAEHAADDAALAVSRDPETYARTVLDVASRMQGHDSRLVWHGAAMSGPLIARRIRRVLDGRAGRPTPRFGRVARAASLAGAVLLICLAAAVDFQSVARAQGNRPNAAAVPPVFGYRMDELPLDATTAAEAAAMERRIETNPEDLWTRYTLLRYYSINKMQERRLPLVLWLIDHHPESEIHGFVGAAIHPGPPFGDAADFATAREHWRAQVAQHPDNARVLWNAARGESNPFDRIDLIKRVRALDPARGTATLVMDYAFFMVQSTRAGGIGVPAKYFHIFTQLAGQIRSELRDSGDIALVGAVATRVVEQATQHALTDRKNYDFAALKPLARELVTHAQVLEPENRAWSDLMEGVKGLP